MTAAAKINLGGRAKWWITVVSLPFYVLLTVVLLGMGVYRFCELHTFTADSIKTEGKIVDRLKIGTGFRTPTTFRFIYTYSTPTGAVFQNQSDVDARTYYSLKSTDEIPVKYLPAQPSRSRVDVEFEDQDEGGSAFGGCVLGLSFLGFGIWAYLYYLKKFNQFSPFAMSS